MLIFSTYLPTGAVADTEAAGSAIKQRGQLPAVYRSCITKVEPSWGLQGLVSCVARVEMSPRGNPAPWEAEARHRKVRADGLGLGQWRYSGRSGVKLRC